MPISVRNREFHVYIKHFTLLVAILGSDRAILLLAISWSDEKENCEVNFPFFVEMGEFLLKFMLYVGLLCQDVTIYVEKYCKTFFFFKKFKISFLANY